MPLMLLHPPRALPRGYLNERPFSPSQGSVVNIQSALGFPMQARYPTGIWKCGTPRSEPPASTSRTSFDGAASARRAARRQPAVPAPTMICDHRLRSILCRYHRNAKALPLLHVVLKPSGDPRQTQRRGGGLMPTTVQQRPSECVRKTFGCCIEVSPFAARGCRRARDVKGSPV